MVIEYRGLPKKGGPHRGPKKKDGVVDDDAPRGPSKRVMYIEQKTGPDAGRAVIAEVAFSRTFHTVYYEGKTFGKKTFRRGRGWTGNYFCEEDDNLYWITGVKKDGSNQHPAEAHPFKIIDETTGGK